MEKVSIWIYNENCARAGHRCWPDMNGDVPEGDVTLYEGTPEAHLRAADYYDRVARDQGAGGAHLRQVARTIREAVA